MVQKFEDSKITKDFLEVFFCSFVDNYFCTYYTYLTRGIHIRRKKVCVVNNSLKIVVMENCKDLGEKVNQHLQKIRHTEIDYMESITSNRFSNGEGKARIGDSIWDKDLYIISDVGNYGKTYKLHGIEHQITPDEHFQDIIRVMSAISGKADEVHVVMPLLYQSRQNKREENESLDCAIALQHLEHLHANSIITFDAHNPAVSNAIPNLPFENFYPTYTILEQFVEKERENLNEALVISPDLGAVKRARYYAEMLGCNMGVFHKRRDLTKVVRGKNPILSHDYIGEDLEGKTVILVDDMIASGGSILEASEILKKKGAKRVYIITTFTLFTEGIDSFDEGYEKGFFDKLYSTNLSYVPDFIQTKEWYESVDCSYQLAQIIDTFHKKKSTKELYKEKNRVFLKKEEVNS